jgi:hypothetical protein
MKLRDFLNNFVDVGGTVIDLYFSNVTFKISVGYNHIEKDTEEWRELIDAFGDKEIESWNVDIYKRNEYSDNPRIEVRCR